MSAGRRLRRGTRRAFAVALGVGVWAALAPGARDVRAAESVAASALPLPTLVVSAAREAQPLATTPLAIDVFAGETLRAGPGRNVDDALRGASAFSLFRRSGSGFANPTAQGVSLRGLGPSGASRALVLLDGVPLNDPFGGWVAWTKLPRLTLGGAEIVRGGGSGAWGNAALGGVVQILSAPAAADAGALALEGGDFTTRRAEFAAGYGANRGATLRVGARAFATDGFFAVAPAQRGAIDRPLDSRHTLVHADYEARLAPDRVLDAGARWFEEERGNGTPLQRNRSREAFGRLRFRGRLAPAVELDALAYAQRQHFASGFSAVAAGRATETPSLDQFDVPAWALGGAAVATVRHAETAATTTLGADARRVTGETNEDFLFGSGAFQRRRVAGGEQLVVGAFLQHRRALAPRWHVQFAARVDRWENSAGRRTETVRATGASVRDDRFPNRAGTEFSPNAGVVWRVTDGFRFRASGQRAFRLPTLNELHRPFRVGSVNTEANAALRRETAATGDVGFVATRGAWEFSGGAFATRFHDAVANVTLSATPTLTSRQRLNLERVRVRGLEARLGWRPHATCEVTLDYLASDARVEHAPAAPALVGKRLAQAPRHTATLRVGWRFERAWTLAVAARGASAQLEDDENQLRLAPCLTGEVALTWAWTTHRSVEFAVENLGDAAVETGRSADGLVSYGAPRWARLGVTQRW